MAELRTDAANTLLGDIAMWMMSKGIDGQEARTELYLLMHDYDITEKTMELVPYQGNKNEELLRRFIVAKTTAGCSPRTLQLYYRSLRDILFKIGKSADTITADDIRFFIARRMKGGISKSTINNERHHLSSFFAWLLAEEMIPKNPMLRIEAVKQQKKKESAFKDDDIELMRTLLRDWREKAVFETLLSTGCRVSELCSIKVTDIQEDGTIYILGKGNKFRNVYLNAKAKITIQKYLEERTDTNPYLFPRAVTNFVREACKSGRAKTHEWWKYPDLVHDELPADTGTIESMVRKLGKTANVENVHPHRFRRTCATLALRKGMPLELVSKMLGHENVGTTQIYLDLAEDDLKQAHKKYVN